jgi:hypothetical protein
MFTSAVPTCSNTRASVLWRVWLAFFAYAAAASVLVQLVLLPHVLPAWHAGHGLMAGQDSLYFHTAAVQVAEAIRRDGWSTWLRWPETQANAHLVGAIYAFSVEEPWVLIPLHAALQATAALAIFRLLLIFAPSWRVALAATLPFLLFPSALTWYTQLLKDTYSIAGAALFICGWALLALRSTWSNGWQAPARAMGCIILGTALAWLIRPFTAQMFLLVGALNSVIVTAILVTQGMRGELTWRKVTAAGLAVWVVLAATGQLPQGRFTAESQEADQAAMRDKYDLSYSASLPDGDARIEAQNEGGAMNTPMSSEGGGVNTPMSCECEPPPGGDALIATQLEPGEVVIATGPQAAEPTMVATLERYPEVNWQRSAWLPAFVDGRLHTVALLRNIFRFGFPGSRTIVDGDVGFESAIDVIGYTPRALQIALFAPFPSQWFAAVPGDLSAMQRRVSVLEMLVIYVGLAFLPISVWRWRRVPALWLILVFCLVMMLILALTIPNIGALYRYRYPYLLLLVALGLAGAAVAVPWLSRWRWPGLVRPRSIEAKRN